eukprot:SAG11_NODE_1667_length_4494_cov_5.922412_5_plen_64_part_00
MQAELSDMYVAMGSSRLDAVDESEAVEAHLPYIAINTRYRRHKNFDSISKNRSLQDDAHRFNL